MINRVGCNFTHVIWLARMTIWSLRRIHHETCYWVKISLPCLVACSRYSLPRRAIDTTLPPHKTSTLSEALSRIGVSTTWMQHMTTSTGQYIILNPRPQNPVTGFLPDLRPYFPETTCKLCRQTSTVSRKPELADFLWLLRSAWQIAGMTLPASSVGRHEFPSVGCFDCG